MHRILALALLAALALTAQAGAQTRNVLDVHRAAYVPDRDRLEAEVRCRSPRRSCAGLMHAVTENGEPFTVRRRVRLAHGRLRRVVLPLRADGEASIARTSTERGGAVLLRSGRETLRGVFAIVARPSCRSGRTVAASALTRVFRLPIFGIYACARPRGRPARIMGEDPDSITPQEALRVRVAGPFVAFVDRYAWKCASSTLVLFDLRERRTVRRRRASTRYESESNACSGTGGIPAIVLRRSGSVAWSETAENEGVARIRVLDARGTGVLDEGPDVDSASLAAVAGGRVGWRHGGALRIAPLR